MSFPPTKAGNRSPKDCNFRGSAGDCDRCRRYIENGARIGAQPHAKFSGRSRLRRPANLTRYFRNGSLRPGGGELALPSPALRPLPFFRPDIARHARMSPASPLNADLPVGRSSNTVGGASARTSHSIGRSDGPCRSVVCRLICLRNAEYAVSAASA